MSESLSNVFLLLNEISGISFDQILEGTFSDFAFGLRRGSAIVGSVALATSLPILGVGIHLDHLRMFV